MGAIEFVNKFCLDKARNIVNDLTKFKEYRKPTHWDSDLNIFHDFKVLDDSDVSIADLKQIIEAFDLVEYCNGLENAKELLDEIDSERWVYNLYTNTVISADYAPSEDMCIRYDVLKQAIGLVEKCNES